VPTTPVPTKVVGPDQQPPRRPRGPGPQPTEPAAASDAPTSVEPAAPVGPPRRFRPPEVIIHFDKLHERIRKVGLVDASPSNLVWSPDSKRLALQITQGGTRGLYTLEFPDDLRPKAVNATTTGSGVVWLRQVNVLVMLSGGLPSTQALPLLSGGTGTLTQHRFTALQEFETAARHVAVFDLAWRTMRDNYYDERLGNNDWNQIRAKYRDVAGQCPDAESVFTIVNLMLGELNGSHLGFFPGTSLAARGAPEPEAPGRWREQTAHLGVRFDPAFAGPGLKIRDVLPGGPADQRKNRLRPGEVILQIDGTDVGRDTDLSLVLNGPLPRDVTLKVKDTDGQPREVVLRPITYSTARTLLYQKWLEDNRRYVEQASGGKLGYLHIAAMSDSTFLKFMEELFAVGSGKDGLVIDVRENGGGSTADHLLTALTQPVHAITVPRGGGPGYPQDRKVYATWNKPIIVLCNQNSFSNAEIFSHAIKTLKRGKLVGVPTAGGVISTGGTAIMDFGFLRLPFRGWYLVSDGEDLELNGAVPDVVLWPEPGAMPSGKDEQLAKAVELLLKDVEAWKARPVLKLKKASERPVP
jgi:tricorn protease